MVGKGRGGGGALVGIRKYECDIRRKSSIGPCVSQPVWKITTKGAREKPCETIVEDTRAMQTIRLGSGNVGAIETMRDY
jgi:hypothetical protein